MNARDVDRLGFSLRGPSLGLPASHTDACRYLATGNAEAILRSGLPRRLLDWLPRPLEFGQPPHDSAPEQPTVGRPRG
jgi:hypothetical protein